MRIDNFYLSNEVKKPWLRPNIDPHKWYTDNIFLGVKRSWLQLKIFLVKNHFWGKVYWIFVELWCFSLLWMSSWLKRYYFSKPLGLDQYCEHCFFLKRGWWTCSEGALKLNFPKFESWYSNNVNKTIIDIFQYQKVE